MYEELFVIILCFLVLLAAFDLFVGVSNDAVNFLNSAIGSRVASFKVVMLVASIGVLIGATFSSGMMEIARSGVFVPDMFTFHEIILIFFSVMVADILLLDAFNSLGLPTSTTVSIVFELLGGAVAAALIKLWTSGQSLTLLGQYINNEKALAIVSGILISVVVAFISGMIVQYICRLIFTFHYEKMYRRLGGVFGGIALTAIFYFLVMKGAKGASFMHKEYLEWINANTWSILICLFAVLTVIFQCMILFFKVNVFRIVILSGTFSLAFAFAGNDLVNFVGVPLAAYESFLHYTASGMPADVFTMEGLRNAVQTPTFYLLLSGLIMVLTLWFSKKAHRVVQTSINLSSSVSGEREQFGSSLAGRLIVRSGLGIGRVIEQFLPKSIQNGIASRMVKPVLKKGEVPLPFDQVRASINLIVASILIASATSLKLPLSTTYVTFMVAMGSSFADGAWDRESAVYRISGVLTVISGWFLTAFCAFTLCGIVNSIVNLGGEIAVIAIMLLAVAVLIKTNFINKMKEKHSFDILINGRVDPLVIRKNLHTSILKNLDATARYFDSVLEEFFKEHDQGLKKLKNMTADLSDEISQWRKEYYTLALVGAETEDYDEIRHLYYRVYTNMKEVGDELQSVSSQAEAHIANQHRVYHGELRDNLLEINDELKQFCKGLNSYLDSNVQREEIVSMSRKCQKRINKCRVILLRTIDSEHISLRSSELYMNFLQFVQEAINKYVLIAILLRELDHIGEAPAASADNQSPDLQLDPA